MLDEWRSSLSYWNQYHLSLSPRKATNRAGCLDNTLSSMCSQKIVANNAFSIKQIQYTNHLLHSQLSWL